MKKRKVLRSSYKFCTYFVKDEDLHAEEVADGEQLGVDEGKVEAGGESHDSDEDGSEKSSEE